MDNLKLDLSAIDYLFVVLYFVFVITVGIIVRKRAGKNRKAFFLSGQNLPWWLLGTSMVATTFSIGAPLMVAGWSREFGIAKNWEWWVFLFGQMFTTFFFAKLWRRTNVFNDAEFIGIRYSGKSASFLRGFRSLYMGFIMNLLVMGTGLIAAAKIGTIIVGIGADNPDYRLYQWGIAGVCGLVALSYSCLSGYAAIVITDFVGFVLATVGSILMAYFICQQPELGSFSEMVKNVKTTMPGRLDILTDFGPAKAGMFSAGMIIAYSAVRWWAQIYGGAEPGGGSHVVQRMSSARTEKDALLGTLWFNLAHYVVRPLPWIIIGLASIFIFPMALYPDHEKVYLATIGFLPIGLKGLVVASLFAAFLTTIDTRLNLGASYFVNDFYKPFIKHDGTEKHYVVVSRLVTVAQLILSYGILFVADDVRSLFYIYAGIGSGAGLVYILRFYWWRITAWSEIAAMTAAVVSMSIFRWGVYGTEAEFNEHAFQYMFISLGIVTAVWLLATFISRPTDKETLKNFFRQVRPAGPFWRPISTELEKEEGIKAVYDLKAAFIGWLFSGPMTFGYLFGLIYLFFGEPTKGLIAIAIGIVSTVITVWSVRRITADENKIEAGQAPPDHLPENAS